MKAFQFAPGLDLRVIERDGAPWFIAKDVCEVLGLAPKAQGGIGHHLAQLDPDDVTPLPKLGEKLPDTSSQHLRLASESGLYALIMRSHKPEAKAFQKWVTPEVLPAIRKNGGYMAPAVAKLAVEFPAEFMARALVMANETIQGLQKAARGRGALRLWEPSGTTDSTPIVT